MQRLPEVAPPSRPRRRRRPAGDDAEEGLAGRARLHLVRGGEGGDHDPAGLGLPPGVDDRAMLVAHGPPIPEPGLRIDRLADAAEQADRAAVVLLHRRLALAHQGADRGRGGVEDVHPVPLDHVPEAREVGMVGHALEHQAGRAVGERAVDDIAVAGDPAHVGGAPEDLARPIVEHVMEGGRGPDRIAAGRVQDALGLAGRARRVEDEERILGAHRLARAMVGHCGAERVVPMVAALAHPDLVAEMADDDHAGDRAALVQSGVDIGLQRDQFAAAPAAVGGDHEAARAILDAAVQRLGREAAEDDAVDGADPRAGEHRHRRLRDHRHVDGDAVALAGAERLQAVRHPHHLGMQRAIGDGAGDPGLVALEEDGDVGRARFEMAVDAIVTEVQNAVLEPFDIDRIVAPVGDPAGRRHPVDPLRLLGPEAVRIIERAGIERAILLGRAMRARSGGSGGRYAVDHVERLTAPPRSRYCPRMRPSPPSGLRRRRGASRGCSSVCSWPRIIAAMSWPSRPT
jgi:hypothetical protein